MGLAKFLGPKFQITSVRVLVRPDGPEDTFSALMALWDVVLCDFCRLTAHSAAFPVNPQR
jgi:hypothetical protein